MDKILQEIHDDFDFYKEKVNQCAGYFLKEKYKNMEYTFEKKIIDKMHSFGIDINDFSNYVIDLCNGSDSKLLFILLFAYNVEV